MLSFKTFIEESKEYKAQEGESEILHHLTTKNFNTNEFHPFSHFGTATAARTVYRYKPENERLTGAKHHAVRLKLGNVVDVPDIVEHTPHSINDMLLDYGHISPEQHAENEKKGDKLEFGHVAKTLRKNGIHTLSYENESEDPGSKSYMITHPSQVRMMRFNKSARVNLDKTKQYREPKPLSSIYDDDDDYFPPKKPSSEKKKPSFFAKLFGKK